jgi:hypothetical protein
MKSIYWFLLVLSSIGLLFALLFVPALTTQASFQSIPSASETPPPGRPAPQQANLSGLIAPASTAPGYCSSVGGYTSYEYISAIDVVYNPDGTMQIKTHVYIANPSGCTTGSACPVYDTSPEYVNVWIDWNHNNVWESSEKVVDAALTGYANINYHGDMSYAKLVTPPENAVSGPTWLRSNVGWATDPNDPCLYSWTWGNVLDRQVETKGPKITNITAIGVNTTDSQPETGSPVRLEASIDVPSGYTIEKCSWTGDLTPGQGDKANKCRYEYTPATGAGPDIKTYGEKAIKLTVSYKYTATGATGSIYRNHNYKVYFNKFGDDNGDCQWYTIWNGCAKNWFEYWKDDGAVPGLAQSYVKYGNFSDPAIIGGFSPLTHNITIGDAAALSDHSYTVPKVDSCPGYTFPGASGIDLTAITLSHEGKHKTNDENWHAFGPWFLKTDTDHDGIPDDYEASTTKTDPKDADTCNLAGVFSAPDYANYGDDELTARLAEQGVSGVASKDWANPGKQTNIPFSINSPVAPPPDTLEAKFTKLDSPANSPAISGLTGTYSDAGIDANGNALFDFLRLSVGVQVDQAADYVLTAYLEDGSNTPVDMAQASVSLTSGTYLVDLNFNGYQIRHHAVNGPYKVSSVLLTAKTGGHLISSSDYPYTTGAYAYSSFEPVTASFNNSFSSSVSDTDADGYYNLLVTNVGVQVQTEGTYTIYAELYGSDAIATASRTQYLNAGANTVTMQFDGQQIYYSKSNGPYSIKNISIKNAAQQRLDFFANPYFTPAYSYTSFQHGPIYILNSGFTNQGLDANNNGLYDYLRIQFMVSTNIAGDYPISAYLKSSDDRSISQIQQIFHLNSGINTLNIDFPGGQIRSAMINGPYNVSGITLMNPQGVLADVYMGPFVTYGYSYASFDTPLLSVSDYTFSEVDSNNNGKIDFLKLSFPIYSGGSGEVNIHLYFTDNLGNGIQPYFYSVPITANTTKTITVIVWGSTIIDSGRNGPFRFRDLTIYHSADINQPIFMDDVFVTPAYQSNKFDETSRILIPVIRR